MTELKPRAAPRTIDETLDLLTGADYVADLVPVPKDDTPDF